MKMPARFLALFAPTLLAVAFAAAAAGDKDKQVVWKLVDKNGRITYADKEPPKGFVGKVTRIEVDLRANRATLVNVGESSPPVLLPLTAPELKRVRADAELARARENLEEAKQAREEGKEPTPEETKWIGNVRGGARPVPTDAFHERIKALDEAVKVAEEAYERARKAARMAAID